MIVRKDKHKAESCNLQIRIQEDGGQYIADLFTDEDMFVRAWIVSKDSTTLEDFLMACETVTVFVDTGKW